MAARVHRNQCAQSLIEVSIGLIIIVPVVLFLLDVVVLVVMQTTTDNLTKNIARHLASLPAGTTNADYVKAATAYFTPFTNSPLILQTPSPAATITATNDTVVVNFTMPVRLLVPVPFVPQLSAPVLQATATEPVTSSLSGGR